MCVSACALYLWYTTSIFQFTVILDPPHPDPCFLISTAGFINCITKVNFTSTGKLLKTIQGWDIKFFNTSTLSIQSDEQDAIPFGWKIEQDKGLTIANIGFDLNKADFTCIAIGISMEADSGPVSLTVGSELYCIT